MNKKKLLFSLLKILVSGSLIVFLLLSVDWPIVGKSLRKGSAGLISFAFLLNVFEYFELTYKWSLLVKIRNVNVSFWRLFFINSIGIFLGLFLPSSIGTDIIRGYYLVKNNEEKEASISSVFVDRILGLVTLLLLVSVAIVFADDIIDSFYIKYYVIGLFLLFLFFLYLFQKNWMVRYLHKLQRKIKYKRVFDHVIKLHCSILEYKRFPKTLWFSFFLTLLVQFTRIIKYYIISLAFGVNIPIVYFFLFVPLVMIVIVLPISIGGVGLKEGAFVGFFTLVGVSIDNAFLISFVNSFLSLFNAAILGGSAYLFYRPPREVEKL